MTTENFIHYYAEPVKAGYSILRCDIVLDGEIVQSFTVGSPAPTEVIKSHERRATLRVQ